MILRRPVDHKYRVSLRFGRPWIIFGRFHKGTDFACPIGTKGLGMTSLETVVYAGYDRSPGAFQLKGGFGLYIKTQHISKDGNLIYLYYAHLSKTLIQVGQKMSWNVIAYETGNSGNSTGPHLHVEGRMHGESINLEKYFVA